MSEEKKIEISGMNIYTDKKGRTVYYDFITKNGYIIPPNKYNSYTNYSIRLLVSVLVGYLSSLFLDNNYFYGFIVGVSTYIAYSFVFRKRFLSSLSVIPDFKRPYKESYIDRNVKNTSKKKNLSIVFVAMLLLPIIVLNLAVSGYDTFTLILSIALGTMALGFAIVHLIILKKQRDSEVENEIK